MSAAEQRKSKSNREADVRRSRRRFLRRAALGVGALLVGGTGWTFLREPEWLEVRRVRVPIPDLPPALDGFTIAQVSDLHAGRLVSPEFMRRGLAMAMEVKADLICLTGDYVWGGEGPGRITPEEFSSLRAEHGVFAILGNHDYWSGRVKDIRRALTEAGLRVLVNESAPIEVRGTRWWLCGLDDVWSGKPDLQAARAGLPKDAFHVLLCHEPDFADEAAAAGVPLQLSGHSHGGQVRLPLIGALILPLYGRKYPIGLQRIGHTGSLVYTNVGLGVIAPPVRFNCRPEVSHLTLVRAS